MTTISCTYSPEDNKLRLNASSRLDAETFASVKAAGFRWAPKQDLFFATWSPGAEDLATELAGEIDDEDKSLVDRAEERAERFEGYSENRLADAESARAAVSAIAEGIPFGQPILVGHHSEKHARRDAARIDAGMRKAVKMWETSGYWAARADGAVRAAKYKEQPAVRARRIKTIEADKRKQERNKSEADMWLKLWTECGNEPDAELQKGVALRIANMCWLHLPRKEGDREDFPHQPTAHDALTNAHPTLYAPRTLAEIVDHAKQSYPAAIAYADRWIAHYEHRLAYERAMLGESGGTVADRTGPEKGGACRCWASPGHGRGWSYIQKVNKVSVTVLDDWGNGGAPFTRTIPFDKLKGVMTAAEVQDARDTGRLVHSHAGAMIGFYLAEPHGEETPALDAAPVAVEEQEEAEGAGVDPTPEAVAVERLPSSEVSTALPEHGSEDNPALATASAGQSSLHKTTGAGEPVAVERQEVMPSISVRLTRCVNQPTETATQPESVAVRHALRSTFSMDVADRLKAGRTIGDALRDVLGGIQDASAPKTSDVLADLEDMGAWHPDPVSVAVERREPVAASLGAAASPRDDGDDTLTKDQVDEIRARTKCGEDPATLAAAFGIGEATVDFLADTAKPGPCERAESQEAERPPALAAESDRSPPEPANDPYVAMRESLRAGVKVTVASQLFPTPRALAERMAEEAGLKPGDKILEPSAGTGRLIDAAIASGWSGECLAVEINPHLATALLAKYDGAGVLVHHGDFLTLEPGLCRFDKVIMNPPFADSADIRHVRHAARFLKPGGRLVAIMSAGVTFRSNRMSTEFREFVESRGGTFEPLPPDSFKECGTSVSAALVVFDGE